MQGWEQLLPLSEYVLTGNLSFRFSEILKRVQCPKSYRLIAISSDNQRGEIEMTHTSGPWEVLGAEIVSTAMRLEKLANNNQAIVDCS